MPLSFVLGSCESSGKFSDSYSRQSQDHSARRRIRSGLPVNPCRALSNLRSLAITCVSEIP